MAPLTMEICVDSLASVSATIEYAGGQNRYEVCSNLISGGGLTPSYGLVHSILQRHPKANLMVMIRPRVGGFTYTDDELSTMESDIAAFKQLGVMGVVFGCLTEGGDVDMTACRRLVNAARPLQVTFHRAFDVTSSWRKAFDDIVELNGVTRILTSGHSPTAPGGVPILAELMELSSRLPSDRTITIVPGSGVNHTNLPALRAKLPGLREFHLTGSGLIMPQMTPSLTRGAEFGFGSGEEWRIDTEKISKIWELSLQEQ